MNEEPLVRVITGTPTPEELAALVGVLAGRSRRADAPAPAAAPAWARSARPGARHRLSAGWRASALPR